jgi:ribosomal protein S18 acetylase RimI-like enzyme
MKKQAIAGGHTFPYFRNVKLSLAIASANDAALVAALRNEAAQHLVARHGEGHWSYQATEKGVLNGMTGNSKVLIAKQQDTIVGSLRLTTKKPWAIDPAYFTKVMQPLYLVDMAVHPGLQRRGIGKYMLQEVHSFVTSWPAQSLRLDAYDAAAGAGDFYRKCGFKEKGRVIYRKTPLIYFEWLA